MTDVELIEQAIAAMRVDADSRWHAVAGLLAGTSLNYARLVAKHPRAVQMAVRYPDAGRAAAVARAYLEAGRE